MNHWRHIAGVSAQIHEAIMSWARGLLQDAGLETVEVYGQFPPSGTVSHHVVLFPYRVQPEPKVAENAPGLSLLGGPDRTADRVSFAPPPWLTLGRTMTQALEVLFPGSAPSVGRRSGGRGAMPFPPLRAMPRPFQDWYRAQPTGAEEHAWVITQEDEPYTCPPSLWWFPAITVTTRYIAVAGEPGRGTAERTSAGVPMSLPVLSVLATGLHLERVLYVRQPPLPLPEGLAGFVEALAASVTSAGDRADQARRAEIAEQLLQALAGVQEHATYPVMVMPIHDLNNHEFALIMQALQRPLQPALNLAVRLPLGAAASFGPGTATDVRFRLPQRGEPLPTGTESP